VFDASADALDAGDDGAPGDAGDGGGSTDAGPCSTGLPGPALVPVGDAGYCIDSTEVTNADYAKFLAGVKDAGLPVPAFCGKNTPQDWAGGPWTVGKDEARPVVQVDWCDAYWFCKWAGKRLCGDRTGGALAPADMVNPVRSQWQYACTGGTSNDYPYGPTYDPARCNGAASGKGMTVDAGSMAGCIGGVPGLHDMSGNVWEWIDSCDGNTAGTDHCANGAGGWQDGDPTLLKCKGFDIKSPRTDKGPQTGIRCCSP